jgi:hypothetical protein
MTWHNTKEIGWHTIKEIEWHSIQEIGWHKMEEIRHLGNFERQVDGLSKDNRGLRLAAGIAEGGETGIAYTVFLISPFNLKIEVLIWTAILAATVIARTMLAAKELRSLK